MGTLGIIALVAIVLGVALVFVPLSLSFNLQARGEPSGFWAFAGGCKLGPVAASGIAAKGVEARVQVHAFGRQLWQKTLGELARPDEPKDDAETEEPGQSAVDRAKSRYAKLERWLDPVDLFFFLTRERRRIELLPTVVDVDYGFRDIALTGKLLGAIYALSAFTPAALVVRQHPSWESVDRAALAAAGAVRFWPGLVVVDSAWYLIRNVKVRRRAAARPATTEAP